MSRKKIKITSLWRLIWEGTRNAPSGVSSLGGAYLGASPHLPVAPGPSRADFVADGFFMLFFFKLDLLPLSSK